MVAYWHDIETRMRRIQPFMHFTILAYFHLFIAGSAWNISQLEYIKFAKRKMGYMGPYINFRGKNKFQNKNIKSKFLNKTVSSINFEIFYCWTNLPTWAPITIYFSCQGLFAAANIFSSLKLVYIFSVNPHLGQLQVRFNWFIERSNEYEHK